MSNAGNKNQNSGPRLGPKVGKQLAVKQLPSGPMGPSPMGLQLGRGIPAKDDMRSRIIKLTQRYRGSATEDSSNVFRVRAEILYSGEEYYTVNFGCSIGNGLISVPWKEYPSAELEIKFGKVIERADAVQTAVRRSSDRLGRELTAEEAVSLEGTEIFRFLLKSSKDFKSLPLQVRESFRIAEDKPAPRMEPVTGAAKRQLEDVLQLRKRENLNWAKESQDSFDARGSSYQSAKADMPGTKVPGYYPENSPDGPDKGRERKVPSPNGGGGRSVPPPSGAGSNRPVPPPTTTS